MLSFRPRLVISQIYRLAAKRRPGVFLLPMLRVHGSAVNQAEQEPDDALEPATLCPAPLDVIFPTSTLNLNLNQPVTWHPEPVGGGCTQPELVKSCLTQVLVTACIILVSLSVHGRILSTSGRPQPSNVDVDPAWPRGYSLFGGCTSNVAKDGPGKTKQIAQHPPGSRKKQRTASVVGMSDDDSDTVL